MKIMSYLPFFQGRMRFHLVNESDGLMRSEEHECRATMYKIERLIMFMYTRKIDARGARQTGNFLEQGIMFRSRPGWLAMRERIQRNYPD